MKRGSKKGRRDKPSPPKTVKLADIVNVRCNEDGAGKKLVRLTLKNGTWVELVATGVMGQGVHIDGIDEVRTSFDFKS